MRFKSMTGCGLLALSTGLVFAGQSLAQADGPLACKLVKFTGNYVLECQILGDYVTFKDVEFQGKSCLNLQELYRRDGRLKFGAVPPEIGKIFKSGDQFSLSVKIAECPDLTEATIKIDAAAYAVKLR